MLFILGCKLLLQEQDGTQLLRARCPAIVIWSTTIKMRMASYSAVAEGLLCSDERGEEAAVTAARWQGHSEATTVPIPVAKQDASPDIQYQINSQIRTFSS